MGFSTETTGSLRNPETRRNPSFTHTAHMSMKGWLREYRWNGVGVTCMLRCPFSKFWNILPNILKSMIVGISPVNIN